MLSLLMNTGWRWVIPFVLSGVVAASCATDTPGPSCVGGGDQTLEMPDERIAAQLSLVVSTESATSALVTPSGALWVGERAGRIVEVQPNGEVVALLDLTSVVSTEGEGGLLDFAADPGWGSLYVSYTDASNVVHLVSYTFVDGVLMTDRATEHLKVPQPSPFHTGGSMAFGPDGLLYLGIGDGALPGDERAGQAAQDPGSLRGKILRIDPHPDGGYVVPAGNPYPESDAPSVWVTGLRNPWAFSFDPLTGDLWIPDVGEACWEEINRLSFADAGANLGWPLLEGTQQRNGEKPPGYVAPAFEYRHIAPGSAIIGGVMYRGSSLPGLVGRYVYADFGEGALFALTMDGSEISRVHRLDVSVPQPTRLVARPDGEIIVVTISGRVFLLEPAD